MLWALHDAPVADPTATLVLIGLADHAADDGTGAWPGRATLARYARCSTDTVDRRLAQLVEAGVIARGDQQLVARYRPDRRPVVYDLLLAGPSGGASTGPQPAAPSPDGSADQPERGRRSGPAGPQVCGTNRPSTIPRTSAGARPVGARADTPAWCRTCDTTHRSSDPCDGGTRRRRPAPPDLRAIVAAARQED